MSKSEITNTCGWGEEHIPRNAIYVDSNRISIDLNNESITINKKGLKYLLALIEVKSNE